MVKSRDGNVLTSDESVVRRWKKYFKELKNVNLQSPNLNLIKMLWRDLKKAVD